MRPLGSVAGCFACNTHFVGNRIIRCGPDDQGILTLCELFPSEHQSAPIEMRQELYPTGQQIGTWPLTCYPSCELGNGLLLVCLKPEEKARKAWTCDGTPVAPASIAEAYQITIHGGPLSERTVTVERLKVSLKPECKAVPTSVGFLCRCANFCAMLSFMGTKDWISCTLRDGELKLSPQAGLPAVSQGFCSLPAPLPNGGVIAAGGVGGDEKHVALSTHVIKMGLAQESHSPLATFPGSGLRGVSCAFVGEGFLLGFGGRAGTAFADSMFIADIKGGSAAAVVKLEGMGMAWPPACERPALLARNRTLYVLGGYLDPQGNLSGQAYAMDFFDILLGLRDRDLQTALARAHGYTRALEVVSSQLDFGRRLREPASRGAEAQADELENKVLEKQAALDAEQARARLLSEQLERAQESAREAQASLALAQKENGTLRDKVAELEPFQAKVLSLNRDYATVYQKYQKRKTELGEMRAAAAAGEQTLREAQDAQTQLARRGRELETQLEAALSQLGTLKEERARLEEEAGRARAAGEALTAQMEDLQTRHSQVEVESRGLRDNTAQLTAQNAALKDQVERLEADLRSSAAAQRALAAERDRLGGELRDHVGRLRADLEAAMTSLREEQARRGQAEEAARVLQSRLDVAKDYLRRLAALRDSLRG